MPHNHSDLSTILNRIEANSRQFLSQRGPLGVLQSIPVVAMESIVTSLYSKSALLRNDCPGFKEDYLTLHCLLKQYAPSTVAEIGTCTGRGTNVICNAMGCPPRNMSTEPPRVFSLDVPPDTDLTIIYPQGEEGGEDGHPVIAGMECVFHYQQLYGFSDTYDFSQHYPLEGWFIDGKTNYQATIEDSSQAFLSNPKLVVWHDAEIPEVEQALIQCAATQPSYSFFRVSSTRIVFAVRVI